MNSESLGASEQRFADALGPDEMPPLDGVHLVLAGPGTGKTALLVQRVSQALNSPNRTSGKVLALTFTNKAAGEMRARLRAEVPDIDAFALIGTFHAFGSHVLRAHGAMLGIPADFVIYDEDDQLALLNGLQSDGEVPAGLNLESLVRAFGRLKSRGLLGDIRPDETPDISVNLREIHEIYRSAMRRAGALDYGDLILECASLFRTRPNVLALYQTAFPTIVVDEFQDTTPAQYEVLSMLAAVAAPKLFAVADEDQLIFEWNEARLETLNRLCADFEATVTYSTLTHRCPPNVVEAANAVISHNRFRFLSKPSIRSGRETSDPIHVHAADDEHAEGVFVAQTIGGLVGSGTLANDIAVIGRTRRTLEPMQAALQEVGVPTAQPSLAGLGGTEEADVVLRLLRWLQNSRDENSARRVLSFLRPQDRGVLETAAKQARDEGIGFESALAGQAEHPQLGSFVERLVQWRLLARDTRRLLATLLEQLPALVPDTSDDLRRTSEFERVLHELLELAQQMSASGHLGLPDFLLGMPQVARSTQQGVTNGAVSLLTYHQSKGLEFEVVFLVGLEDGSFPDFRSEQDTRRLEEERRLFYVGLTRTRAKLFLTWSRVTRTARGLLRQRDPSRFIGEIPETLLHQS